MANRLNLDECSDWGTTCKGYHVPFILKNTFGLREVLNEGRHCPGTEALFSAGLDIYLGHCTYQQVVPQEIIIRRHSSCCSQNEGKSSHFLIGDENANYLVGASHRGPMNHEDMIDIHDWSSFYFQISVDKEKTFPSLLDGSEGESYSDDNKVKF